VVYRTDARSAGQAVEIISIPPELNVVAEYPVAVVQRTNQPALAREFVDLLLSPQGQEALVQAGFQPGKTE
jgi:molybdate transport system substrate-binding protein